MRQRRALALGRRSRRRVEWFSLRSRVAASGRQTAFWTAASLLVPDASNVSRSGGEREKKRELTRHQLPFAIALR
jgi:hypothetical protein